MLLKLDHSAPVPAHIPHNIAEEEKILAQVQKKTMSEPVRKAAKQVTEAECQENIKALIELGFDRESAKNALLASLNNPERAFELLEIVYYSKHINRTNLIKVLVNNLKLKKRKFLGMIWYLFQVRKRNL